MTNNPSGVVAYADFDAEGLVALAKAAFIKPRETLPARFAAFLPLFPAELAVDMDIPTPGRRHGMRLAPNGVSVEPAEYHRKLFERMPALYAADNYLRNFTYEGRYVGHGAFTVDEAWAEAFPQYRAFLGDRLVVYLIGGGAQAVAVPESVYPRAGGMLPAMESAMGIVQSGAAYVRYARARILEGEAYDAEAFAAAFLSQTERKALVLSQGELEHALQEMALLQNLGGGAPAGDGYTENARLAAKVNQYQPMRYACDWFHPETAEERVTRLIQPAYQENDFIGDLWTPYPVLAAAVDRRAKTLDARGLCESCQIAPRYDPRTGGGLYPDTVYVAMLRDRAPMPLVAETRNNPAYGAGTDENGEPCHAVFLQDSRELIRQGKLTLERVAVTMLNREVPPDRYRRMLALAELQEHKGRLIDALYAREAARRQGETGGPSREKAEKLLDARAERLFKIVEKESERLAPVPPSPYDEDIAYLCDKESRRTAGEDDARRDEARETRIEAGYAMRARLTRLKYGEAEKDGGEADPPSEEPDDGPPAATPETAPAASATPQPAPAGPAATKPHVPPAKGRKHTKRRR